MGKQRACEEFRDALDDIATGRLPSELERKCERVEMTYGSCCKAPEVYSQHDWTNKTIKLFKQYFQLKGSRKSIEIHGATRHIAPETEVLDSLTLGTELFSRIVLPYFKKNERFTSGLVKDNYNLGLAYLSAVVQSCASGFVPLDQRVSEKRAAINIARQTFAIKHQYNHNDETLTPEFMQAVSQMSHKLSYANKTILRPYEVVLVDPKKIHKKELCENEVSRKLYEDGFSPDIILPVAHGGVELGLEIDYQMRKKGHQPDVFPIFYSVKTRRHEEPKLEGDERYFGTFRGKKLLITEDWITTGKTLIGLRPQLNRFYPGDVRVATLKQDPNSMEQQEIKEMNIYAGVESRYLGSKE